MLQVLQKQPWNTFKHMLLLFNPTFILDPITYVSMIEFSFPRLIASSGSFYPMVCRSWTILSWNCPQQRRPQQNRSVVFSVDGVRKEKERLTATCRSKGKGERDRQRRTRLEKRRDLYTVNTWIEVLPSRLYLYRILSH